MIWSATCELGTAYNWSSDLAAEVLKLLPPPLAHKVRCAYGEIIANAIQASFKHKGRQLHLSWKLEDGWLTFTVINHGIAWEPTFVQRANMAFMPCEWDLRGRGLPIIYLHTDSIAWHRLNNATMTVAKWRCHVE